MQTFGLSLGNWLRHLALRNPLVRGSDRIEAAATLLVIGVILLAAPVAGAIGTAVYDNLQRSFAEDRLDRHPAQATVTHDSALAGWPYEKPFSTTIRWQFEGTVHTEEWRTSDWMKAGDRQDVWIDADGNHAAAPLSDRDAATQAIVTAFGLWLAVAGTGAATWIVLRMQLDRSRYADWDRALTELADNGGRTNHN